jgi:hypothetical protein
LGGACIYGKKRRLSHAVREQTAIQASIYNIWSAAAVVCAAPRAHQSFFCARKCSLRLLLLSRGEHPHKAFLVLRCENETSHTAAAAVRSSSLLPSRGQIRSIILLFYFAFDCCRDFLSLSLGLIPHVAACFENKIHLRHRARCRNKIDAPVLFFRKAQPKSKHEAIQHLLSFGPWENEEIIQHSRRQHKYFPESKRKERNLTPARE